MIGIENIIQSMSNNDAKQRSTTVHTLFVCGIDGYTDMCVGFLFLQRIDAQPHRDVPVHRHVQSSQLPSPDVVQRCLGGFRRVDPFGEQECIL